jgi:hypothetical protein
MRVVMSGSGPFIVTVWPKTQAPPFANRIVAQGIAAVPIIVLTLVDVDVAVVPHPAGVASATTRAAGRVGARRVVAAAVSSVREGIKKIAGACQMPDAVHDSPAVALAALVNICAVLAVPPLRADAVPSMAGAAGAAANALTEAL